MEIGKNWKAIWIVVAVLAVVSSASLGVSFAESIRLQQTQDEVAQQFDKPVYSVHVVGNEVYFPSSGLPASVVLIDDAGYTYRGVGIGNLNAGLVNIEVTERCEPRDTTQCSPAELLAVSIDDASALGVVGELKSIDQNGTLSTVLSVTSTTMIGLQTKNHYVSSNYQRKTQ